MQLTYVQWFLKNYPARFWLNFEVFKVSWIVRSGERIYNCTVVISILVRSRYTENVCHNTCILLDIFDVFLQIKIIISFNLAYGPGFIFSILVQSYLTIKERWVICKQKKKIHQCMKHRYDTIGVSFGIWIPFWSSISTVKEQTPSRAGSPWSVAFTVTETNFPSSPSLSKTWEIKIIHD